ncbi:MAG TPA: hypothetical protein DCY27_04225 [Desulfobacterales bacterium]|jgi:hypothetical protein|nr:hypothetical protein [Desulfobacterales bacterium]
MDQKEKAFSVYIRRNILSEFTARGGSSVTINRDLTRLYALYRRAIREVPLAEKEACLIVDALNSSLFDANSASVLHTNIEDACRLDGLGKKWEVDCGDLVEKLRGISPFHCMALIDAAECWWNLSEDERDESGNLSKFFNIS